MIEEKKYLVKEVKNHLIHSKYVFLINFSSLSVLHIDELKKELFKQNAKLHIVKNSILRIAIEDCEMPTIDKISGPNAIITGGNQFLKITKILVNFNKKYEKNVIKSGIIGDNIVSYNEMIQLALLPSLEILRLRLISLLSGSSRELVAIMASPFGIMLNLLKAKFNKN